MFFWFFFFFLYFLPSGCASSDVISLKHAVQSTRRNGVRTWLELGDLHEMKSDRPLNCSLQTDSLKCVALASKNRSLADFEKVSARGPMPCIEKFCSYTRKVG